MREITLLIVPAGNVKAIGAWTCLMDDRPCAWEIAEALSLEFPFTVMDSTGKMVDWYGARA